MTTARRSRKADSRHDGRAVTEYYVLRAAAGALSGALAWRSERAQRAYWMVYAGALLAPTHPWEEWWKLHVQAPAALTVTLATLALTIALVWQTRAPQAVRRALLGYSAALGAVIVLAGWSWEPERPFQSVMIARQYIALGTATMAMVALSTTRWLAPARTRLDGWWVGWTWTLVALSATTKGGLLWSIAEWEGGLPTWRAVSDAALAVQMGMLAVRLTRQERTTR